MPQNRNQKQRPQYSRFAKELKTLADKCGIAVLSDMHMFPLAEYESQKFVYAKKQDPFLLTIRHIVKNDLVAPKQIEHKKSILKSRGLYVINDIPEYQSPLSGKMVSSRKERREEMKQFGVREVDPSECRFKQRERDER